MKINRKFFIRLGQEVKDKIQVTAQSKGEDHKGAKFRSYSDQYRIRKAKGKAVPKGQSVASRSTKPDLTLTGTMWRNLNSKAGSDYAEVGFSSRQQAIKANHLSKTKKRIIFSEKNVHPEVDRLIKKLWNKEINKVAKKSLPKGRTLRIG